jgi:predicted ArsR family transcriptional regulator
MLNIFSKEVYMRKSEESPTNIIRTAAAAAQMYSVAAIADTIGVPQTTLRKHLKNFSMITAGELSAMMAVMPALTDEEMGKAIRRLCEK